jgi:hypothetical protein
MISLDFSELYHDPVAGWTRCKSSISREVQELLSDTSGDTVRIVIWIPLDALFHSKPGLQETVADAIPGMKT